MRPVAVAHPILRASIRIALMFHTPRRAPSAGVPTSVSESMSVLESKGALWKVAVASDLGFGIRRHRLAPTSVLVWDVVWVVASPVCLREITMLEWLPHKMIFVVCPRAP